MLRAAVGLFLLRPFLRGPQDVAVLTDTAGEATRRMWTGLGGWPAELQSLSWFRLFRPLSILADDPFRERRPRQSAHFAQRVAGAVDRPLSPRLAPRAAVNALRAEPLVPETLLEGVAALAPRLGPAYRPPIPALAPPERRVCRFAGNADRQRASRPRVDRGLVPLLPRSGGMSDVLQVVGVGGRVGEVVDHMFVDAQQRGAATLRGRIEPRLLEPLARRQCLFRYNGGALVHARDDDVAAALSHPDSLLTRIDGEWWMGHHLESFA